MRLTFLQDWLYEEGEDTTKAKYMSKMDDIRFIAGPIIQRHVEKLEAEADARRKVEEEALAKKRAEIEAKRKAEEEAKKAAEPKDTEMKDADAPSNGDSPMNEVE